jgi:hypothetical protein
MARPPIIISNGGVRDELTKFGMSLMECNHKLNNDKNATLSRINTDCNCNTDDDCPVPFVIWRLKNENRNKIKTYLKTLYPEHDATLGEDII